MGHETQGHGDERRTVASILASDGDAPKEHRGHTHVADLDDAEEDEVFLRPRKKKSSMGKMVLLTLCTLVLFSAAVFGMRAFVGKNGMPDLRGFADTALSVLGSGKKTEGAADDAAAAAMPAKPAEKPAPATVSALLKLSVKPLTGESRTVLVARVVETDVSAKDTVDSTGVATVSGGKSEGNIVVTNTSGKPYTFVATTRFLSHEGVLFRLKANTNIPATGSVTVAVAADQPGPNGDIQPTTFIVPGLPADAQKFVTGKSDARFTGGSGEGKGISEDDLVLGHDAIAKKLRKDAEGNFSALLGTGEVLVSDLVTAKDVKVDAPKVGAAMEKFTMTLTQKYRAMLLPEKDVTPLLQAAIAASLPGGEDPLAYTLGAPLYTIEAYDAETGVADIRAEAPLIKQ